MTTDPLHAAAAMWANAATDDRARSACPCHGDGRWCDPWEDALSAAADRGMTDRLFRAVGLDHQ